MNAPEARISCRWKHLRGEGSRAIFRATCGLATCPGHLGDLTFFGSFAEQAAKDEEEAKRESRKLELAVARGRITALHAASLMRETAAALEQTRRLRDLEKAEGVPAIGDWCMQASQVVHNGNGTAPLYNEPIYYGHGDTGYRISHRGKRSQRGVRVGRRSDVRPALLTQLLADDDQRGVDGQEVRPPARIWCPVCDTLNQLDWPEPLQDPQAR